MVTGVLDTMAESVRVVVCGDENTGKSSLIASFVKDLFVSGKIQPVLPPITIGALENITTTIVDTSGQLACRDKLSIALIW